MKTKSLTTAQIAVLVAIATFSSNILGFIREMILANFFGAGMVTDAYIMGTSIPNTLMAAIVSATCTAYTPILAAKFETQGENEANKFTSQVINLMTVSIAVVFLISLIFSDAIVGFFAPGYDAEKQELTVYYMRFAFICLFFSTLMTFLDTYLRYRGHFVAQKWVALIQNICVITFIWLSAIYDYHLLVFGTVVGMILSCLGHVILAKKSGYSYVPNFEFKGPVKEVLVLALPVFIGGGVSEINTFIDKMLGSNLAEGSVTALNYSGRLISLIMTFTVGIFTTIIYPKLNQAFAKGETDRIGDLTERGINLLSLLTIPFSLGAMVYANQLVKIVYERGAFSGTATDLVTIALFYYSIRIPFYAVSQLINNDFYAMHDMTTAVYCSIVSVVINIALNLLLVRSMGVAGLALATSIAEISGTAVRYILFRKKYNEIVLLRSKRKLAKITVFSIISVGISYLVYLLLAPVGILVVRTGIAVIAAMLVYLVMLKIAKFEELKLIKDLVSRG